MITEIASLANKHNQAQDLSAITLGANDELFFNSKPILSGIDIPSLYCYLLSQEKSRDAKVWAVNLLNLQKQKYYSERVIADDADDLRQGHSMVLWNIPCDYDNFHLSRDMMELRRYFRNRVKSLKTEFFEFPKKVEFSTNGLIQYKYRNLLLSTDTELKLMSQLSSTIDTLISWMEHDVLNMPGTPKNV